MTVTILQALLGVLLHNQQTMEEAFAFFAVNTRDGFVTYYNGVHKIEWIRGEETNLHLKVDKKGRLFVAKKFENFCSWSIDTNRTKNQLRVKPAIIQMNVLRASGKRGGYLIRFHVQTPILARTKKFQFHGKWIGFWTNDTMLQNNLWTRSSKGKFGKATFIDKFIQFNTVMDSVRMLNNTIAAKNLEIGSCDHLNAEKASWDWTLPSGGDQPEASGTIFDFNCLDCGYKWSEELY